MTGDLESYSRSILQSVDDFSQALAMMAPRVHALFTLMSLDQKLEFMKAYEKGYIDKLRELLQYQTLDGNLALVDND